MFIHSNLSQDRVPSSPSSRFFWSKHALSPYTSRSTDTSYPSTPSSAGGTFSTLQSPNFADEHHDHHALLSGARSFGRALAELTKWERDMPSSKGIDYFTYHALYRTSTERLNGDTREDGNLDTAMSRHSSLSIRSAGKESTSRAIQKTRSFDSLQSDDSSYSVSPDDPSFRAKQRRAKFAKLTRHLGENIPPELVTQSPGRPGTPQLHPPPKPAKKAKRGLPLSRPLSFAPPVEYILRDAIESDGVQLPFPPTNSGGSHPKLEGRLLLPPDDRLGQDEAFINDPTSLAAPSGEATRSNTELSPPDRETQVSPTLSSCSLAASGSISPLTSGPNSPLVGLGKDTDDATAHLQSADFGGHREINDPFRYDTDGLYQLPHSPLDAECFDGVSFEMRRTRKLSHFFGVELEVLQQDRSVGVAY